MLPDYVYLSIGMLAIFIAAMVALGISSRKVPSVRPDGSTAGMMKLIGSSMRQEGYFTASGKYGGRGAPAFVKVIDPGSSRPVCTVWVYGGPRGKAPAHPNVVWYVRPADKYVDLSELIDIVRSLKRHTGARVEIRDVNN